MKYEVYFFIHFTRASEIFNIKQPVFSTKQNSIKKFENRNSYRIGPETSLQKSYNFIVEKGTPLWRIFIPREKADRRADVANTQRTKARVKN